MDNKKICFICCTNNLYYEEECRNYISHLRVPEGMQVEIQMIHGAKSMTAGYNEGMRKSNAKYKVYLHQDLFVINPDFIEDLLQVFKDKQVGMIGVVGGIELPKNGIIYSAWNCGRLNTNDSYAAFEINGKVKNEMEGLIVEAVDGCLIATQYDLPWREDLFDGWDFYDVSQSFEFRKAGYLVKVPYQKKSWCMHDDGYQSLKNYDYYREILLREYGSFLQGDHIEEQTDFNLDLWNTTTELKESLIQLFEKQEYKAVYAFIVENYVKMARETELSILRNVMEIWYEECMVQVQNSFVEKGISWEEMYQKYQQFKFWLYQMEYRLGKGECCIEKEIQTNSISAQALIKLLSHTTINVRDMLYRLADIYRHSGQIQTAEQYMQIAEGIESQWDHKKGKIAFILCTNNEQYEKECEFYINELEVPTGYEVEIIPIVEAKSMTAGYNQGMHQSDAKYKVYLHQDVFIWNRHFLYDMLDIFEHDEKIGMLGVLGGTGIPNDGVLYTCWNEGQTYACDTQDAGVKQGNNSKEGFCQKVEALDGMLIATQYDLPWREDLFDAWDFYDISQSFEFRKQGYAVVVPHQKKPWCMHDCGRTKLQNYNTGRKILLQEYEEFFQNPNYSESDFSYNDTVGQAYKNLKSAVIDAMESGNINLAKQLCGQYDDSSILDTDLSIIAKLISVAEVEQQLYKNVLTWTKDKTYQSVLQIYNRIKFLLWRVEQTDTVTEEYFIKECMQSGFSLPLLIKVAIHNVYDLEKVMEMFLKLCIEKKSLVDLNYLEFIAKQISEMRIIDFAQIKQKLAKEETLLSNNCKATFNIEEVERICNETAEIRKRYLPEYTEKINLFLQTENRMGVSEILSNPDFAEKFETDTNMAYMMLSNQIYLEEVREQAGRTIFDGRFSIEEVIALIQEIKFHLWHLEFETDPEADKEIICLVREHQISGSLLKYMVHIAGMDKLGLLERLAAAFLDYQMFGLAFSMLKYSEELAPGAEDILCTMAELCLKAGKKTEALECLNKVANPTQTTEVFRKMVE